MKQQSFTKNVLAGRPTMDVLHTRRCLLCRFESAHIDAALPLFTSSEVRAYLGGPIPAERTRKRLEQWARQSDGNTYFSVILPEKTLIGVINITPYHEADSWELSYLFYLPIGAMGTPLKRSGGRLTIAGRS